MKVRILSTINPFDSVLLLRIKFYHLGYYITIPYFIIYSCVIFVISNTEYPFITVKSYTFSMMIICSLICYILFFISILFGIEFHRSYFNYIAFIGLFISTCNIILIINYKNKHLKFIVNFLIFQLIQIYLYLAHLLSVKFELNIQSESKVLNIFNWCWRQNESIIN